jgi:hypothetical protein
MGNRSSLQIHDQSQISWNDCAANLLRRLHFCVEINQSRMGRNSVCVSMTNGLSQMMEKNNLRLTQFRRTFRNKFYIFLNLFECFRANFVSPLLQATAFTWLLERPAKLRF